MNENINLCEILKGHEGEEFYSKAFHYNVKLIAIKPYKFEEATVVKVQADNWDIPIDIGVTPDTFYPSKEQTDWNVWVEEQKTPKTWSEYITYRKIKFDSEPTLWFYRENYWGDIGDSCIALFKIQFLIEACYGGIVSQEEWESTKPFAILYSDGCFTVNNCWTKQLIAFHTKEQAEEFLSYDENVQLLKDYFQVNI